MYTCTYKRKCLETLTYKTKNNISLLDRSYILSLTYMKHIFTEKFSNTTMINEHSIYVFDKDKNT